MHKTVHFIMYEFYNPEFLDQFCYYIDMVPS